MILTQYYKVYIQDVDVTKDVDGIKIMEEDGLFTTATVPFRNGYLWMETIGKGNTVKVFGGTTSLNAVLQFSGYVNIINPDFQSDGEVTLTVECFTYGHIETGIQKKSTLYPSESNEEEWAKSSPLRYSYIIEQIAKDSGYEIGRFSVAKGKDKKATFKAPISQKDKTTWKLLNDLAADIDCVIWEEFRDGKSILNCVDEEGAVNTISKKSFYFVARAGSKFSVDSADNTMIRLISANLNLDTNRGKAHQRLDTKTNPATGEEEVKTDTYDAVTDKWTEWVFKEELLAKESEETKDRVFEIVTSSRDKLEKWETIQKYFIKSDKVEKESQNPLPEEFTVTESSKNFSKDKQYTTTDALNNVPPEDQSELLKRATNGELTDEDFALYFKESDRPDDVVSESNNDVTSGNANQGGTDKKKKKTRRDEGFSISAQINGVMDIKTKMSYLVQGLGKYSATYYLYKIEKNFGEDGFMMNLTFTK